MTTSKPSREQSLAAAHRVKESLEVASKGHGRFSAWLTAPQSFNAEVSTVRLQKAVDCVLEDLPIEDPTALRLLAEAVRSKRVKLKSWAGPRAEFVVEIDPADLLLMLGVPTWV